MTEDKIKLLEIELGKERVKRDEPLTYHTYYKSGGPAEVFYIATNEKELVKVLDLCVELKLSHFIIGGGTKLFISNQGIKGVVIKNRTSNIKISSIKGKVGRAGIGIEEAMVEMDSGVSIGKLNSFLDEQKLSQIKTSSPDPSSLGGAIFIDPSIQNASTRVKVWEKGSVFDLDFFDLRINSQVVLSMILKVKAKE